MILTQLTLLLLAYTLCFAAVACCRHLIGTHLADVAAAHGQVRDHGQGSWVAQGVLVLCAPAPHARQPVSVLKVWIRLVQAGSQAAAAVEGAEPLELWVGAAAAAAEAAVQILAMEMVAGAAVAAVAEGAAARAAKEAAAVKILAMAMLAKAAVAATVAAAVTVAGAVAGAAQERCLHTTPCVCLTL